MNYIGLFWYHIKITFYLIPRIWKIPKKINVPRSLIRYWRVQYQALTVTQSYKTSKNTKNTDTYHTNVFSVCPLEVTRQFNREFEKQKWDNYHVVKFLYSGQKYGWCHIPAKFKYINQTLDLPGLFKNAILKFDVKFVILLIFIYNSNRWISKWN